MDKLLLNYSKSRDNKFSLYKYYWTQFFVKSASKTALILKEIEVTMYSITKM